MRTSVELVIFDCDGVPIDSEPIANRVFSEQLAKAGMRMTPEEVWHAFAGNSRDRCIAMAGEMRGEPLHAGFARQWDGALHAALDAEARPVEGVAELLRSLPVPYCVASNGEPTHMQRGLAAGMRVFAYVGSPMNQRAELERLGATPFTRMRELPALLGFA